MTRFPKASTSTTTRFQGAVPNPPARRLAWRRSWASRSRKSNGWLFCTLLLATGGVGKAPPAAGEGTEWQPFDKLSEYQLFVGDGSAQQPAPGVLPYDINTPLFSDYANKIRFVQLPPGT